MKKLQVQFDASPYPFVKFAFDDTYMGGHLYSGDYMLFVRKDEIQGKILYGCTLFYMGIQDGLIHITLEA